MSYLEVPRLHFSGIFIANPSTINNDRQNYDPAITDPSPGWNSNGNHYWQFKNCTVRSAVDATGKLLKATTDDPLIGAAVASTDSPSPAKLVDLDTDQQMVSEVWGLQVKVAISATDYFIGRFRVAPFDDIWGRLQNADPNAGDVAAGAYYQSVLDLVSWSDTTSSPLLQALKQASPAALSIKFVVDRFQGSSDQPDFTQGRIVGTIGPQWADEPPHFVIGRLLRPHIFDKTHAAPSSPLNYAPTRVDAIRKRLLLDLGNSIPTTQSGAPPKLGKLQAAIIPANAPPVILGNIDYSQNAYETSACIQEFSLTDEQVGQIAKNPVGVVQVTPAKGGNPASTAVLLQENPAGAYANVTQFVYRMNPGDVVGVELIATQFGAPAANQTITLKYETSQFSPANNKPRTALTFPASVKTGHDGRAAFCMTAGDPGNPRKFIDGQVYGVRFSWAKDNDPQFPRDPNKFISVRVFDSYDKAPTWENLQPILQQYAKLYPFMVGKMNIADLPTIQSNIQALQRVLNMPINDPRYMPVTRDMSRDKRQLLIEWLNLGAPGPAS
ncbi:MAG: hypothetical protein V7641_3687 [Blastocatellia bacterium]